MSIPLTQKFTPLTIFARNLHIIRILNRQHTSPTAVHGYVLLSGWQKFLTVMWWTEVNVDLQDNVRKNLTELSF